ncbi:hypothetical protein LSCM1_07708 [Leishmania martiniquensis]|uniref:MCM C-terminal AAA(+) ATPase domain-containing protein n=1 Tax=Leishmania martiniquensis TaxID=1580590 RepID=A0A836KTW5_9TRYP|nr:hypothetical protein LSCM1_07708 [Leishmania martiniquensis]
MRGERGGGKATSATTTGRPAAPAAAASSNAWMDALWQLHCGTPLAGAVRYTDAVVEAMWGVFQPLLIELDVYPLAMPELQPESVTATTAATVPFTDFIILRLVEPTAPARHGHSHRGGGVEEDPASELGNALTPVMRTALLEQPRIVLALFEFFVAVWLYQHDARQLSTSGNVQCDRQRQGGRGAPSTASAASASTASRAPALRRVYAAVCGDIRHATPFDHLGAAQLGRLLTVKGTAVRMSPTRISCLRMLYRCGHCGAVKEQATEDGVLTYPGPCASVRCRGYKWAPLTDQAVCEEVQLLRLQEHTSFFDASTSPSGGSGATQQHGGSVTGGATDDSDSQRMGNGGMHVMIEVELRPPWLDAVTVGDCVCVCGVLETRRGEGKQGSGMQQVCLRARAVRSLRSQESFASTSSLSSIAAMQRRQRGGALLAAAVGPGGRRDGPWRPGQGGGAAILADGTGTCGAFLGNDEGAAEDALALGTPAQLVGVGPVPAASAITALPSCARVSSCGFDSWSAEETGRFYEAVRHPQWFARLTASVAPSIFGMELVKQALLLSIVGGNRDKNGGETRSSIHVLLVGDPGLGKSQLLRAACAVAPRSAFVCAHTSSSCGLTMTLTRDPVSGETTFEAGAVVHGDGGITCLDEIDKGVHEHKALLEVMEQETVSLAKAGMIFSMPVRTSVLAAGNPIGGRFDVSKSLAANVNLSPALLSRFDVIACLRNPHGTSSEAQQALTDHVLQWHRRGPGGGANGEGGDGDGRSFQRGASARGGGAGTLPLPLVQRFLLFSRSQCQPTLCPEACDVLQAHYLAQRQHLPEPQHGLTHGIMGGGGAGEAGRLSNRGSLSGSSSARALGLEASVTPRYLQALIRVAEARAKLELRHVATREDAEYAVHLLQACLHSFDGLATPGSAVVGAAAGSAGAASGKRPAKLSQRDAVLQRLQLAIVEENHGVNLFTEQAILSVCESVGCRSAAAMLRQLNEYGFLLQNGSGKYCLRGC